MASGTVAVSLSHGMPLKQAIVRVHSEKYDILNLGIYVIKKK